MIITINAMSYYMIFIFIIVMNGHTEIISDFAHTSPIAKDDWFL